MSNVKEYKDYTDLLDKDGKLNCVGWAKNNFFNYDRSLVTPRSRLKEWDFYSISDGKYFVVVALFNITLAACPMISIFDLENQKRVGGKGPLKIFSRNSCLLPLVSDKENLFEATVGDCSVKFETLKDCKKISFKCTGKEPIDADFTIYSKEKQDGITTVTPFKKPNQFFLANKIFAVKAEGSLKINGSEVHKFNKDDSFGTMDWGRGVWPAEAVWYWANGSKDIDGHTFGFNFTWAINEDYGDLETVLSYDGQIQKIGKVDVEKFPKTNGFMNPWHIKSEDGRFDAVMEPTFDNSSKMFFNLLGQNVDQVFGKWTGFAILDDGTKIEFKDMIAFCEYVESRW